MNHTVHYCDIEHNESHSTLLWQWTQWITQYITVTLNTTNHAVHCDNEHNESRSTLLWQWTQRITQYITVTMNTTNHAVHYCDNEHNESRSTLLTQRIASFQQCTKFATWQFCLWHQHSVITMTTKHVIKCFPTHHHHHHHHHHHFTSWQCLWIHITYSIFKVLSVLWRCVLNIKHRFFTFSRRGNKFHISSVNLANKTSSQKQLTTADTYKLRRKHSVCIIIHRLNSSVITQSIYSQVCDPVSQSSHIMWHCATDILVSLLNVNFYS